MAGTRCNELRRQTSNVVAWDTNRRCTKTSARAPPFPPYLLLLFHNSESNFSPSTLAVTSNSSHRLQQIQSLEYDHEQLLVTEKSLIPQASKLAYAVRPSTSSSFQSSAANKLSRQVSASSSWLFAPIFRPPLCHL